jgi:hypothetical protein
MYRLLSESLLGLQREGDAAFGALGSSWRSDRGLQIEALDAGGFRVPLRDDGADRHIELWLVRGQPIATADL